MDRMTDSGSVGCGFESRRGHRISLKASGNRGFFVLHTDIQKDGSQAALNISGDYNPDLYFYLRVAK